MTPGRQAAAAALPALAAPRFHRGEIALAVVLGLAIEVCAVTAVRRAAPGPAPEREAAPAEVAVKVRPVVAFDRPLLRLGGRPDPRALPDRSLRKVETHAEERRVHASTRASPEEPEPPPDVPLADAGPPEPDAPQVARREADPEAADAAPANLPIKGDPGGVREGTEEDPLRAQAASVYHGRLVGWLSGKFAGVHGTGLDADALLALGCGVQVTIGADRKVLSYTLATSGNAAFDGAARAALERAKGQEIPPPPENHPELAPSTLSVRFVCRKGQCD